MLEYLYMFCEFFCKLCMLSCSIFVFDRAVTAAVRFLHATHI